MERVRFADRTFGIGASGRGCLSERGYYYLLLGKPLERNVFATFSEFWPLELWHYKGEEAYGLPPFFYLIFYQPEGIGDYRLYYPGIEGPEKLVIPNVGTRANTRNAAAEILRKTNSELASASLSYLPGERPYGSGSFSSDSIIAAAKALPEKKYNDAYARGYLTYKDYVETDYADNYIGAGAKVRLFRAAGQPFLHWTIEPDRMSFARRGDEVFAGFELVLRMEDRQGKLIFERTEEIPVRMTPEQYKANERRRFAFQDILPLVPGDRRLFFLFKNKTSREFTSFETTVSVPAAGGGPALSSLLLLHGRERLPDGQRTALKAFTFEGVQCVVSAKNEFLPAESLEAFIQVSGPGTSRGARRSSFSPSPHSTAARSSWSAGRPWPRRPPAGATEPFSGPSPWRTSSPVITGPTSRSSPEARRSSPRGRTSSYYPPPIRWSHWYMPSSTAHSRPPGIWVSSGPSISWPGSMPRPWSFFAAPSG